MISFKTKEMNSIVINMCFFAKALNISMIPFTWKFSGVGENPIIMESPLTK